MTWCSQNDGVHIDFYDFIRKVTQGLYYALNAGFWVCKIIGKAINIFMPSGCRLPLFDGVNIPNFVLPDKKFWAIRFTLLDFHIGTFPLLKRGLKAEWQSLVHSIDYGIPGSEDVFKFWDEALEIWKYGNEFSPVRRYGILEHGVVDGIEIAKVYAIAKLLTMMGLQKIAKHFLVWFSGVWKHYTLKKGVGDVLDITEDNARALDALDTEIESLGYKASDIISRLGVRFALG